MPLVCKLYSNLNYLFVSLLTPESWYNFSRSCNRECSDHHQLDAMLVEFSCNKLIKFWMWLYQNLFWKFPTHCVYIIQSQLLKHVTTSQFFVSLCLWIFLSISGDSGDSGPNFWLTSSTWQRALTIVSGMFQLSPQEWYRYPKSECGSELGPHSDR